MSRLSLLCLTILLAAMQINARPRPNAQITNPGIVFFLFEKKIYSPLIENL